MCVELNWLTLGDFLQSSLSLKSQTSLRTNTDSVVFGKAERKKIVGGKNCNGCVLQFNEVFFCCWPIFKKSHSSSRHVPLRLWWLNGKISSRGASKNSSERDSHSLPLSTPASLPIRRLNGPSVQLWHDGNCKEMEFPHWTENRRMLFSLLQPWNWQAAPGWEKGLCEERNRRRAAGKRAAEVEMMECQASRCLLLADVSAMAWPAHLGDNHHHGSHLGSTLQVMQFSHWCL